jgi:hypothetical protein
MFDSSPSSFRFASKTDDEAGAGKTKSDQITHLMHYKASTMFPLRQLQSLLIVIPSVAAVQSESRGPAGPDRFWTVVRG